MTKWLRKLLGKNDPTKLTRFEVVYREQVWCKTDKEAAKLVLGKLRNHRVELMVKQFTSKVGDDDKALLTFVKAEEVCPYGYETTESEITETKTTTTRL